jgi:enterobactin synthetase component D
MLVASAAPSKAWLEPPAVVDAQVHGCATTDLRHPSSGTKREREFAAGRRCAARALRQAGAANVVVGVGPQRRPIWPPGFVGSITHTAAFAWAVAASTDFLRSVGIDSEPIFDQASMRDAARLALDEHEWQLAEGGKETLLATIVFSGKESLFKCLNPCVGEFFEFADVRVERLAGFAADRGTFEMRLLRSLGEFPRGRRFAGRYMLSNDHVHTAVELPT